jgi:hypothetical protein
VKFSKLGVKFWNWGESWEFEVKNVEDGVKVKRLS